MRQLQNNRKNITKSIASSFGPVFLLKKKFDHRLEVFEENFQKYLQNITSKLRRCKYNKIGSEACYPAYFPKFNKKRMHEEDALYAVPKKVQIVGK